MLYLPSDKNVYTINIIYVQRIITLLHVPIKI
jgi:hypothetical protein